MDNNIYDNDIFFEGYRKIRQNENNYNDLLEQPAMVDLLPYIAGKKVLDLGCGYGKNCLEFIKSGAGCVLGIDISSKMLEVAKQEYFDDNITYQQLDMTDISTINQKFDFVYSSLAFHYIENFDKLISDIFGLLNKNGILLFSQEHPIVTATLGYESKWNKNEAGEEVSYTFSNYNQPGIRKSHWIIDNVITYHRTIGEIVTTLANKGFLIEALDETSPKDFAIKKYPQLKKELLKPNFLIIRAKKL
jgi:SAM-dependent methyltransferase